MISNKQEIDIYFTNPGTLSQRGLNEHSNGLLRLPKQMDSNTVDERFIQSVASKRNHIPRKSLNHFTPLEVFLSCMNDEIIKTNSRSGFAISELPDLEFCLLQEGAAGLQE